MAVQKATRDAGSVVGTPNNCVGEHDMRSIRIRISCESTRAKSCNIGVE